MHSTDEQEVPMLIRGFHINGKDYLATEVGEGLLAGTIKHKVLEILPTPEGVLEYPERHCYCLPLGVYYNKIPKGYDVTPVFVINQYEITPHFLMRDSRGWYNPIEFNTEDTAIIADMDYLYEKELSMKMIGGKE